MTAGGVLPVEFFFTGGDISHPNKSGIVFTGFPLS